MYNCKDEVENDVSWYWTGVLLIVGTRGAPNPYKLQKGLIKTFTGQNSLSKRPENKKDYPQYISSDAQLHYTYTELQVSIRNTRNKEQI